MLNLPAARAEALFCAPVPASPLTRAECTAAIQAAVRTHHGHVAECAADMAYAFGECPEVAAARMRWARETVAELYARRGVAA